MNDASPYAYDNSCSWDGIPTPCAMVQRSAESGAGDIMVEADVYIRYGSGRIDRYSGKVSSALAGINEVWRGRPAQVAANGFYSALQGGLEAAINAAFRNVYIWQNDRLPEGNRGVRNYAHASPQNPYDPRVDFRDYAFQLVTNGQPDDCLKLALLAYKAGEVFPGRVINGLLEGLTDRSGVVGESDPNFRVGVLARDPFFGGGFTDDGFIPMFQDPPRQWPRNQVRHFVGWFAAGAFVGPRVARRVLYQEEGTNNMNNADVALGMQAINMGYDFSRNQDHRALAQAIWRDICGREGQLNLP